MVRWEGGRSRFLIKSEGCNMSPRFNLLVSDVNQVIERAKWVQDFLACPQE